MNSEHPPLPWPHTLAMDRQCRPAPPVTVKPWQLLLSSLKCLPRREQAGVDELRVEPGPWRGPVCPWYRKSNSDSECLQQSKGLFAGCQARRTGSSCSKDPDSLMAFRQGFLKTVLGERVEGYINSLWTFWLVGCEVTG